MAIRFDRSSTTVVIICEECDPRWRGIRFDLAEAHACAANHERLYHHESFQARDADRRYRGRHADDSSNVPTPSAFFDAWDSETSRPEHSDSTQSQ